MQITCWCLGLIENELYISSTFIAEGLTLRPIHPSTGSGGRGEGTDSAN
jgi:hypothetical protein